MSRLETNSMSTFKRGNTRRRLQRLVGAYPEGTALMRMRKGKELFDWAVAAAADDNEETLKAHAGRWMPFAELMAVAFNRPNESSSATSGGQGVTNANKP